MIEINEIETKIIEDEYRNHIMNSLSKYLIKSGSYAYEIIIKVLSNFTFSYKLIGDEDRMLDGLWIRDSYLIEQKRKNNGRYHKIETVLNRKGVSLLEVFAALAMRMDFDLSKYEKGAYYWFNRMIKSIKLECELFMEYNHMSDFKDSYEDFKLVVERWCDIFNHRGYYKNGMGSIFIFENYDDYDTTQETLWDQASWFVSNDEGMITINGGNAKYRWEKI